MTLIHSVYEENIAEAGDVVWLVECLPSMHKTLDSVPSTAYKIWDGATLFSRSRPRDEKLVQWHPLLNNEFEASLAPQNLVSLKQKSGRKEV